MKLKERQLKLYEYIMYKTKMGDWTTKEDIGLHFTENWYRLEKITNKKGKVFHNCPLIYYDIRAINESDEVDNIIIVNNNNFKLATKEEAEAYAQRLFHRALGRMKVYSHLCRKMKLDGYARLIDNEGNVIDETSDKYYINTYYQKGN